MKTLGLLFFVTAPVLVAQPADYIGIVHLGQSLCLGQLGTPTLSTTQPFTNQTLANNINGTVGTGALTALIEGTQESPASSAANNATWLSPAQSWRFISTKHCFGGTAYSGLKKGGTGTAYVRSMDAVNTSKANATAQGKTYKTLVLINTHGEADYVNGANAATYQGYLQQWYDDYNGDIKAATGQSENVVMLVSQMASWPNYAPAYTTPTTGCSGYDCTPSTTIGQLYASRSYHGKIFLAGPKYQFTYSDGTHLTNSGYRQLGGLLGYVLNQVVRLGVDWHPVSPRSITMAGTTITAKFFVPSGTLVFDTTAVSEPSGTYRGFKFVQTGGSTINITNASISGDTITFTLSGTPDGTNPRLAYAYSAPTGSNGGPTTGPRGNLRDSVGFQTLSDGTQYHWGVTFIEGIPFSDPNHLVSQPVDPTGAAIRLSGKTALLGSMRIQ